MSKLLIENPEFDGVLQTTLTELRPIANKTGIHMHVMQNAQVKSFGLNFEMLRNEARKNLLKNQDSTGVANEYEVKSERNIQYWLDKFGYEITEIITKGRIKLCLSIDSPFIVEDVCEDWKLIIDDLRKKGGRVEAYGKNKVGAGASEIFYYADEQYALAWTNFRWLIEKLKDAEDLERARGELRELIEFFKQKSLDSEEKDELLRCLKNGFINPQKRDLLLRIDGIVAQKLGMLSGISLSPQMLMDKMRISMWEALGINLSEKPKPASLP
jgi:hypothetical protein